MLGFNKYVFFGTCAFGALLAWLSGYNFDYRSPGVAVAVLVTIVVAVLLATCPFLEEDDE